MNIRDVLALAPVIPVLTVRELAHAAPLARALAAGGLRVIEVTMRTPIACEAIAAMGAAVPDAIVGAGTLVRPADFTAAAQAGARFVVTPGLTPELNAAARTAGIPLLPGAMTPSEIVAALAAGYDTLKFFPAHPAGGVAMLNAFAGPFAEVVFCPTGGISRARAPDYLALDNVACVGGSWVAPEDKVAGADWAGIEELAREAAGLLR